MQVRPSQVDDAVSTLLRSDDVAVSGPSSSSSSASAGHSVLPATHPISLKLHSILTTSTSAQQDENAKRALRQLEELYTVQSHSKSGSRNQGQRSKRRGNAAIDIAKARHSIENDAHERLVAAGDELLSLYGKVDEALETVQDQIAAVRLPIDDLDEALTRANDATAWFLDQAKGIQRQRASNQQQQTILSVFLSQYTLTESQQETINSRDALVNSEFFAAMDRLTQIRENCRFLLEGGSDGGGGTKAGTEIMADTGEMLEKAYDKLARYLTFQFRQTPKEHMDVSRNVRQSVSRMIDQREDMLRPALQILVSMRSNYHASQFQRALTSGASGSRPIDLHAHDPMRYVGDMLAWIHQTVASEREFIGQLLGESEGEGGRRMGESRRKSVIDGRQSKIVSFAEMATSTSNDSPGEHRQLRGKKAHYMRELVDRCLEGVCRPLKLRIEQTVSSQEGCLTTFKLANLVHFYRVTLSRAIGSRVSISRCLDEISEASYEAFFQNLDRQGNSMLRSFQTPDKDLSPSSSVMHALGTLKEILDVHRQSLSETTAVQPSTSPDDELSTSLLDFDSVIDRLVTPIHSLVAQTQATLSKEPSKGNSSSIRGDLFRVNCLEKMASVIEPYSFIPRTQHRIRVALEEATASLSQCDLDLLLQESRLSEILAIAASQDAAQRRVATTEFETTSKDATVLSSILSHFSHRFLTTSTSLLSSSLLDPLLSPTLRYQIHQAALQNLVAAYEQAVATCEALGGSAQGGEWRNAAEVRMLLGIDS